MSSERDIRRSGLGVPGISRLQRRDKRAEPRKWLVHEATWNDPFPWVMGTFPEKLVFAFLALHDIPFVFQGDFEDDPNTLTVEEFRPDFKLPWCRVIIEVQGEYFHSLPAQAEHDAYKFAIYEDMGWKVYWFWEGDILSRLGELMADVAEIQGYIPDGGWEWLQQIDDLAGLRKMNAASTRPGVLSLKRRGTKTRPLSKRA